MLKKKPDLWRPTLGYSVFSCVPYVAKFNEIRSDSGELIARAERVKHAAFIANVLNDYVRLESSNLKLSVALATFIKVYPPGCIAKDLEKLVRNALQAAQPPLPYVDNKQPS